jgi:hypothetical protein
MGLPTIELKVVVPREGEAPEVKEGYILQLSIKYWRINYSILLNY